ncbi:hypothetical protein ACE38W_17480 [Chitinophaga sp. Hz27]|uniref:Lipoprotein n=1 Tax=Chitinophaga silvatica TaxID=2282649 RepID=A0A3E1YHH3_9BACT|nr:hypothetical protein [Chitinophaga silvatica]RFS26784.1 hypothetical protein DVR12_03080 [Chitinophaga silvatica]
MKALSILVLGLFLVSCGSKKLSREKAAELIQARYPYTIDWNIYTANPEEAAKLIDTDLEKEGFVTVKHKVSYEELGSPIVTFTDKSKPFLLETSEKDKKIHMQRVKLAEQHFDAITGMRLLKNDTKAIVEYTLVYKNVSPFVPISTLKIEPKLNRKAYFALYDDGWRIVEQPDLDFMIE